MANTSKLSRLMKMSWEIQKTKHSNRSRSLSAAWAIMINEDIAVYYLIKRLSPNRQLNTKVVNQFSLFNLKN